MIGIRTNQMGCLVVILFACSLTGVIGCGEGDELQTVGAIGGDCFPNHTCLEPLICQDEICVEEPECVPECGARECGVDPNCGEPCGVDCPTDKTCSDSGQCMLDEDPSPSNGQDDDGNGIDDGEGSGDSDPCADRQPPPHMYRSDDVFLGRSESNAWVTPPRTGFAERWEDLFRRPFPLGGKVGAAGLRPNEYASLRLSYGEGLPAHWSRMMQVNINQVRGDFTSSGMKLFTFSTCPGDFNKEAIESDPKLGPGCFRPDGGMTTANVRFGGPDHYSDPNRCALKPDTTYYLNWVYAENPPATSSEDLEWDCFGLDEGRHWHPDSRQGCANMLDMNGSHPALDGIQEMDWWRAKMCEYGEVLRDTAPSESLALREDRLEYCD